jgi:hypothetical protein
LHPALGCRGTDIPYIEISYSDTINRCVVFNLRLFARVARAIDEFTDGRGQLESLFCRLTYQWHYSLRRTLCIRSIAALHVSPRLSAPNLAKWPKRLLNPTSPSSLRQIPKAPYSLKCTQAAVRARSRFLCQGLSCMRGTWSQLSGPSRTIRQPNCYKYLHMTCLSAVEILSGLYHQLMGAMHSTTISGRALLCAVCHLHPLSTIGILYRSVCWSGSMAQPLSKHEPTSLTGRTIEESRRDPGSPGERGHGRGSAVANVTARPRPRSYIHQTSGRAARGPSPGPNVTSQRLRGVA